MTVSTTNTVNTYTANGSQTVFAFTYQILTDQNNNPDTTTVAVYLNGVLQNTGFTTAANANQATNPGGTVTFSVAPANGVVVKIQRSTPITQTLTFPLETKLSTAALGTAFDKTCLIVQENENQLTGSWTAPTATNPETAGAIPAVNAAGTGTTLIAPVAAGYALIDNGPGTPASFQPVTTAAGGNVIGPATNATNTIPLWNGANSKTLGSGIASSGTAGNVLTDNGTGVAPSYQSIVIPDLNAGVNSVTLTQAWQTVASISSVPSGKYLLLFQTVLSTTTTQQLVQSQVTGSTLTLTANQTTAAVSGNAMFNVMGIVNLSALGTLNFQMQTSAATGQASTFQGQLILLPIK